MPSAASLCLFSNRAVGPAPCRVSYAPPVRGSTGDCDHSCPPVPNEATRNRDKTKQAETLLSLGNRLLEKGDPAQARRAFQSAFGLSTHDSAFNEDARVQLHNLKLLQADATR